MSGKRRNSNSSDQGDSKRVALEEAASNDNFNGSNDAEGSEKRPYSKPVSERRFDNRSDQDDSKTFIHLRILVNPKEAVVIIGKGGSTIAKIREAAGIRLNVSDNIPGALERIVNLRGSAENVAKAAGLIVRVLQNEDLEGPSTPDAKPYDLKLAMPHLIMGALIGKKGSKFREIEEASAARLKALEPFLPYSTDRCLLVHGVADAIHIAVYYISSTYISHKEYLASAQLTPYDPADSIQGPPVQNMGYGGGPGGVRYYDNIPQGPAANLPYGGGYGNRRGGPEAPRGGYGAPYQQNTPMPFNSNSRYAYQQPSNRGPSRPNGPGGAVSPVIVGNPNLQRAQLYAQSAPPGEELSQDVFIPNDFVGSVIGKGGQKIKDIRQFSGSRIRVNDPIPNSTERKITITGTPDGNQVAIYLIHTRIEADKKRTQEKNAASMGVNSENPEF